jgi:hypothetical protein
MALRQLAQLVTQDMLSIDVSHFSTSQHPFSRVRKRFAARCADILDP